MSFGMPKCERFGQSAAVLFCEETGPLVQRRLWPVAREAARWNGVIEAVPAAGNLTLIFDRHAVDFESLAERLLHAWATCERDDAPGRAVEIAVRYDGPDLQNVARLCAISVDRVIELHASVEYAVSFIGFAPGFAYLDGLDARLRVPRLAQPRSRVPAGSVAVAGSQSAVYPFDSPGGWQLIGHTETVMFDPVRDPAALLQPGDRVRFAAV